jgi:ribosomal subunit interface protein
MHLSVKGKQLDVGAALRGHIEGQLPTIVGKYFDNPTDAQVTMSKEGNEFRADITVHVGKGILLQGQGRSNDAHAAFDLAAEHVGKRLRRYKRRLRNHHKGRGESVESLRALQYVLAAEPEGGEEGHDEPDQPVVIAEMETEIETLTPGEAVMRMDLANLPALMFRNRAHGGLNMVYRRKDGNIGWIDPRGERGGVPHEIGPERAQ